MVDEMISECTDCEFKLSLETKKPKSWLKTVSAFANGIGGKIFFGVDDDKQIVGVDDAKHVIGVITDLIDKYISPKPIYKLTPIEENGKIIVSLSVEPGTSTPYYYRNETGHTAFVRSGSSSIEAPDYLLNELILRGQGKTYDALLTGFKKSDFSFSILESDFLAKTKSRFTEEDYVSFGLASKNGFLTNAGVLFADSNSYRQSRLFCTKWNGFNKTNEFEAADDREFDGSLIKQLNLAMDFFRANTKNPWRKESEGTVYYPDYDEEAILEALVNGIVHRSYSNLGAEVCLNIYNDRIEITSPGVLVSGDPLPKYIDYNFESMRRNPTIADLFWKLGYMNRRGSGLLKITNRTAALFKGDKTHVTYQIRNSFFVVTIDNANYKGDVEASLSARQKQILDYLSKDKQTITSLSRALDADRKSIRKDLQKLESLNIIASSGSTKDKYWFCK